jgi:hypothetical protein
VIADADAGDCIFAGVAEGAGRRSWARRLQRPVAHDGCIVRLVTAISLPSATRVLL